MLEFVLTIGSFDRRPTGQELHIWSRMEGDFSGSSGNTSTEAVNRYNSIQSILNYSSLAFFPSDEEISRRIASPIPETVMSTLQKQTQVITRY